MRLDERLLFGGGAELSRNQDWFFVRRRLENSLHLFVGVHTPQPLLFNPAVEAVACDVAPARGAASDLGYDTSLQASGDRAAGIGTVVESREFVLAFHRDHRRAAPGKQRVIDPAL